MVRKIYELPIYDGGLKNWRVLNLNTGTFYCLTYDTEKEARASIVGEERAGAVVEAVTLQQVILGLQDRV